MSEPEGRENSLNATHSAEEEEAKGLVKSSKHTLTLKIISRAPWLVLHCQSPKR